MKVLVAEDDEVSKQVLVTLLEKWGYEVAAVGNGQEAWQVLNSADRPFIAVLDWMMPEMSGIEVCRQLRTLDCEIPTYVIMLTAMNSKDNILEGFDAGADDYIVKPFDGNELKARIGVGRRVVELQSALSTQVQELQTALDHVKTLQGILPICMHCHKIRDDKESWLKIENYLAAHTDVQFSHGICSDCIETHYSGVLKPKC